MAEALTLAGAPRWQKLRPRRNDGTPLTASHSGVHIEAKPRSPLAIPRSPFQKTCETVDMTDRESQSTPFAAASGVQEPRIQRRRSIGAEVVESGAHFRVW